MRGIALRLIVLGMLGLAGVSQAAKISPEPAATLLLPYFEVDIANPSGLNTTFSVNNAFSSAVLAHVTFWSNLSVPFLAFDLSLTGYDQETVDLRDILVNGICRRRRFFQVRVAPLDRRCTCRPYSWPLCKPRRRDNVRC
jgi:hypothetical protein